MQHDVFISYKHGTGGGQTTGDYVIAREVYNFLSSRGLSVFFSQVSLERVGTSEYKQTIDDALQSSRVLVAVGTSAENLASQWVRYEWDGFLNDVLGGFKPDGKVFAYVSQMPIASLPWALRHCQIFEHSARSLAALYDFIANALGREVESAVEWLLSAKASIRMMNSKIVNRVQVDEFPWWLVYLPYLVIDAWNQGQLVVDLDDMRAELNRHLGQDIDQTLFERAVHVHCIPNRDAKSESIHFLLYTPLPHLLAINQPVLFSQWYTGGVEVFRGFSGVPLAPRPIGGEPEAGWCTWLEELNRELNAEADPLERRGE